MKYGESSFDILYLLFAVISGIVLLVRARNREDRVLHPAHRRLPAGKPGGRFCRLIFAPAMPHVTH